MVTRVVTSLESAATPKTRPSRRRLAAAIGVAVVVLFALGFVPVPRSGGKGALARAMAAMESAPSVFVRTYRKDPKTGVESETREWIAAGRLRRVESYEDGELVSVGVGGRDSYVRYDPRTKSAQVGEWRHPGWPSDYQFSDFLDRDLASERVHAIEDFTHLGRTIAEFRESSLWGGTRDIVEVRRPPSFIDDLDGKRVYKTRSEFDPATGRLLSERSYISDGDSWTMLSWTEEINWDIEIPKETWTFTPPPGTKVTVNNRWWSEHPGEPLAVGRTKDWELTLYSIDRDHTGCLYLAVGWRSLTGPHINDMDGWPCATATDSEGGRYVHEPHVTRGLGDDIILLPLHPSADAPPVGDARTVTVTLHTAASSSGCGQDSTQDVTFSDLPLPPVREGDLLAPEEIQY